MDLSRAVRHAWRYANRLTLSAYRTDVKQARYCVVKIWWGLIQIYQNTDHSLDRDTRRITLKFSMYHPDNSVIARVLDEDQTSSIWRCWCGCRIAQNVWYTWLAARCGPGFKDKLLTIWRRSKTLLYWYRSRSKNQTVCYNQRVEHHSTIQYVWYRYSRWASCTDTILMEAQTLELLYARYVPSFD